MVDMANNSYYIMVNELMVIYIHFELAFLSEPLKKYITDLRPEDLGVPKFGVETPRFRMTWLYPVWSHTNPLKWWSAKRTFSQNTTCFSCQIWVCLNMLYTTKNRHFNMEDNDEPSHVGGSNSWDKQGQWCSPEIMVVKGSLSLSVYIYIYIIYTYASSNRCAPTKKWGGGEDMI